jgi:two-component system, sensor histidine kinase and response regulator
MPGMDDLSPTAVLPELEEITGRQIPTTAVAAHAMKEDPQPCFTASMNGHPGAAVRVAAIEETIYSHSDPQRRGSETRQLFWNRSASLEIVGGDECLLNEMVQIFLLESPKLMAQIEQALLHQDPRVLELAAHCLKGELRYLVVPEASEAAEKLEAAGRTGEMELAADSLTELQTRLELLWTALSQNAGIFGV